MANAQKSIIERIAQAQGIYDIGAISDEIKYRLYKLTLKEIQRMLESDDIASASLPAIKRALNEIENGFLYLLNRPKVNKRDIRIVMPKLIDAKAYLGSALTELRTKGKGKTFEYFRALGRCKLLVAEINQDLVSP